MRFFVSLAAIGLLAACQPVTPNDTSRSDGFSAARQAQAQRDGATTEVESVVLQPTVTEVQLDVETPEVTPDPETTTVARTGAISDEQDFDAVAGRETIESDAARLASNRERYTVIAATDLPSRQGNVPNIVQYAIQTNNPVGEPLYQRSFLTTENRYLRNCQKYASTDLAQQDFLARGGPVRDRKGIDPDGDGFACAWDPRPFRAAVSN